MQSAPGTLNERVDSLLREAFLACDLPVQGARAVRATRPELGDMQCNGAMALGKSLKRNPRDIAHAVAEKLQGNAAFDSVEVAGVGFLNLRLSAALLADYARYQLDSERVGIERVNEQIEQVVMLDFGGPNVAKPLHVGHLRSLVIGESLRRILACQGYRTISDVHLGDWGLQMGMLIAEIRRVFPDLSCFGASPSLDQSALPFDMQDLQQLYPRAAAACQADPERMSEAREATAQLQGGHPGYTMLWQAIRTMSLDAQKRDFDVLDAHFDLMLGESDVQSLIPDMVADLRNRSIAVESDGALVIDVAEAGDASPLPPLILAKSDGAALYATTDLATILDRARDPKLAKIVYVVDQRQALHFEQVFRAARRAGFANGIELIHAGFGTVNGADGKPYKTRQGGVAQLSDLLNAAIEKARERLAAIRAGAGDLGESDATHADMLVVNTDLDKLAREVGIGAIKFADLSSFRTLGYVFNPDRMVSFEGRTGPYVQYACVRIQSMLGRAREEGVLVGAIQPEHVAERALLLECARFPEVVKSAAANLAPNELTDYVFGLAQAFSRFYSECPVLVADTPALRGSRLAMSTLCLRVLTQGLYLLGIAVPERM